MPTDCEHSGDDVVEVPSMDDLDIDVDLSQTPHKPLTLENLWNRVLENDDIIAANCGGWLVRLEQDGSYTPPAEWNEIVIYDSSDLGLDEIGRWSLEEASIAPSQKDGANNQSEIQ